MTAHNPPQTYPAYAHELPWREVGDVLAALGDVPWMACLDSGGDIAPRGRWSVICIDPVHVLVARAGRCMLDGREAGDDPLALLRGLVPSFSCPVQVPFAGGAIGFADYRFGQRAMGLATRHEADPWQPEFVAAIYDHVMVLDRHARQAWVAGYGTQADTARQREKVRRLWDMVIPDAPVLPMPRVPFMADRTPRAYRQAVARAREYIAAGDIFQVNITSRMWGDRPPGLSAMAAYRALRATSAAPFGAFLSCGPDFALLCASPERFISLDAAGTITARPIKGTAPRDPDPVRDRQLAHALRQDDKECAENLMIVDLMRNDIGQVARIGSVRVPELFSLERFAHVHHLVSEVRATLQAGHDGIDLLRVTLPPGSVTGAPKHRAMQVIDELESSARGPYCGVVFRIGSDGAMDSSVIIRTLTLTRDRIWAAAGGGITILSDPDREYDEMCLKIAALLAVFGGMPPTGKEQASEEKRG